MKQVLVVDDEAAIRFAFEQFLRDEGYEALLAENSDEALKLLQDTIPDLVFLDYRLPGMDGIHVLEKIRRQQPGLPVIFMTAFGAMEVAIKAMQLGAYEYLTEPLDLDQVRLLIKR
ncbi:MAG: sigma-54-dependent Fis family transcriptional regulator, partial [Deltaproteobacteria bacterium]